jgi:DNA polymerase-3 subunit beta
MKFTAERDKLLRAVNQALLTVERRNTIPILSNVRIEATDGALSVTATDLDLQVSTRVTATIEESGGVTVPAHLLHEVLRELPGGAQVEMAFNPLSARADLVSGRSRFKLAALPVEDFPIMALKAEAAAVECSAPSLSAALNKVAFAQSTEVHRAYLMGVLVEQDGGALRLTATDGNCLATTLLAEAKAAEEFSRPIVPSKFIAAIAKITADSDQGVRLRFAERQLEVAVGETVLLGKLIEGTFPDWRRVVPSQNPHRLTIGAKAFVEAVRRAGAVASEKVRAVRLSLSADKATFSVTSPENGEAIEEAPAAWDAPPIEVGFNAQFLLATVAAQGGEEVQVDLADPVAPALFTNPADTSAQWVVMPRRV